ncbi:hypothetical protein M5689_006280 [Euphorbia peplus]|nr:hypothetical protein M5689_006280 [Euphorbia peplus]
MNARYRLRLIVEDTTGCATFVLFGRLAADLIGVPAHTLAATFKDKHDIPPMLSKLQGLKKTFQVQLGGFIEHPGKLNFKVIYIFKDALLTPKKEILSPLSARSTHLTSPLTKATHSPPAQRALQFNIHESPQKTKSTVCSPLKKRRKETGSTSGQP